MTAHAKFACLLLCDLILDPSSAFLGWMWAQSSNCAFSFSFVGNLWMGSSKTFPLLGHLLIHLGLFPSLGDAWPFLLDGSFVCSNSLLSSLLFLFLVGPKALSALSIPVFIWTNSSWSNRSDPSSSSSIPLTSSSSGSVYFGHGMAVFVCHSSF